MDGVVVPTFGTLLRRLRTVRGLTQEKLAEQAGLSARGISDLERGINLAPYPATIERLTAALALPADDAAALRAAGSRRRGPRADGSAVPVALTRFIGRERELASAHRLVRESRLVTFTGVGGSGKTRLAFELATGLHARDRRTIAVVELAPLADPALVAHAIAAAIEAVGGTHPDPEAALVAGLRDAEMLVVLDNCEHLIDRCAALVARLLQGCPGLRVLATSREPLGIPGEIVFPVPPLATPAPDPSPAIRDLARYEAIRLFADRAAAAQPRFAVDETNAHRIARICHRLDGLPLAIELAAARVRSLSLEDIDRRLDDRFALLSRGARTAPPRHQALRATIDWSHGLLGEDERILFRRLAVFAGGWALADAEAVCADDLLPCRAILDVHARIADKSLMVTEALGADAGRYRLLETIRQYAGERLAEAGETELLQQRHFAYFLTIAEQYDHQRMAGGSDAGLIELFARRDDVRAALTWGATADPAGTLRLAAALDEFWRMVDATEGWTWIRRLLPAVPENTPHRRRALLTAGTLAAQAAVYADGAAMLREAVALARQVGDRSIEGWAEVWLGRLAFFSGDRTGGEEHLRAALAIHEALGNPLGRVRALALLGLLHGVVRGQRAQGEEYLHAAAALAAAIKDRWGEGYAHMMLAICSADAGDDEQTRAHAQIALRTPTLGAFLGVVLQQLGRIHAVDEPVRALQLLGGAAGLLVRTGMTLPGFLRERADAARQRATKALGDAPATEAFEAGRRMATGAAIAFALAGTA